MTNVTANVSTGRPLAIGGAYYQLGELTEQETLNALQDLTKTAEEAGFISVGYVSEDGLTNSEPITSDQITAWGGDVVLTTTSSDGETFELSLIENKSENYKMLYGSDYVTEEDGKIVINKNLVNATQPLSFVFDILLTSSKVRRIIVPNATISDRGEVSYKDDEAIAYNITITAKSATILSGASSQIIEGSITAEEEQGE